MYFIFVMNQLTKKIQMHSKIHHYSLPFYFLITVFLFAISNLFAQDIKGQQANWSQIIEKLNLLEDVNETAKLNNTIILSKMIEGKSEAPSKEELYTIKTNRMKLVLASILMDCKKYLSVDEIYLQIDYRKLSQSDCRRLFELESISILKYPDHNISPMLQESFQSLIKNCMTELAEKPGHLLDLFFFYVNKQMLTEALEIAAILWKNDEYHFQCSKLHQKAYRLRWESKDNNQWLQAKYHLEKIEKDFPQSHYLMEVSTNLIILNSELETSLNLDEMIRKKLFPSIEKLTNEKITDLLDALTKRSGEAIIINLIKDWYRLLEKKNATLSGGEIIITFLHEKCGLSLLDLSVFLNNGIPKNKPFSSSLQNASVQKKVQFLVYWNSEWEPDANFHNPSVRFRYDPDLNISFLITQSKQNEQITYSYEVKKDALLPDYIFLELRSLAGQNILEIYFDYDGTKVAIDKIVCSQIKKLVRIAINNTMKNAKKWQIIIKNSSHSDIASLEISAR
mgnify:CR=1 FL=1